MKPLYFLLYFLLPSLSFAIPPGQWQCLAFDSSEHSYAAFGMNINEAMRAANENCQQISGQKRNCKIAQSYCEQGPIALEENRCLVTDTNGRSWNVPGSNACNVALKLCTEWQFQHNDAGQCMVSHR